MLPTLRVREDSERPHPYQHPHLIRPFHTGTTYCVPGHARHVLTHEGGLGRLTRLSGHYLGYRDVAILATCFGLGWVEWWWFDSNNHPVRGGASLSEPALTRAGLVVGTNARGERAWTTRDARVELVQLGWVDLLVGQRRTFLARVPRWRVSTGVNWRILIDPGEWPEELVFLGNSG